MILFQGTGAFSRSWRQPIRRLPNDLEIAYHGILNDSLLQKRVFSVTDVVLNGGDAV